MTDYTDADDLRTDLEALADDRGEITDDRPTLTVTYTTRQGNERTRTGEAWHVSDGQTFDDAVIRFSADIGGDEDPYYIRVRNGEMTLVSISEQGRETDLGAVESVTVDGLGTVSDHPLADGGREYDRHDIRLRDVVQHGEPKCPDEMPTALVVTYDATYKPNSTFTEVRSVSARLPFEMAVLFDDGRIDVADLTAEERAWIRAETDGSIDFEGTECGPSEVAA